MPYIQRACELPADEGHARGLSAFDDRRLDVFNEALSIHTRAYEKHDERQKNALGHGRSLEEKRAVGYCGRRGVCYTVKSWNSSIPAWIADSFCLPLVLPALSAEN